MKTLKKILGNESGHGYVIDGPAAIFFLCLFIDAILLGIQAILAFLKLFAVVKWPWIKVCIPIVTLGAVTAISAFLIFVVFKN